MNIDNLIKLISDGWSIDTCRKDVANLWHRDNPGFGQDDISALCLHIECGVELHKITINNRDFYINRHSDGDFIDATGQLDMSNVDEGVIVKVRRGTILYQEDVRDRFNKLCVAIGAGYLFRSKYIIYQEKMNIFGHRCRDFFTSDAKDGDYIDITTTGVPFYDELMNSITLSDTYNITRHIKYISPNEYYEECAILCGGTTRDKLKNYYTSYDLSYLKEVILNDKKKFTLPYLNYTTDQCQEGFHRMACLGELFGWDVKFPVLIIKKKL